MHSHVPSYCTDHSWQWLTCHADAPLHEYDAVLMNIQQEGGQPARLAQCEGFSDHSHLIHSLMLPNLNAVLRRPEARSSMAALPS